MDTEEVAAPKTQSVGSMIDEFYELRQQHAEYERAKKDVKAQMELLQIKIIEELDKQELGLGRGRRASASITEEVMPNVEDWDEFKKYIFDNDSLHLLERRPAAAAWRELLDAGELVPGTTPFKKRGLSVRKV
jgi:hypothetical protein